MHELTPNCIYIFSTIQRLPITHNHVSDLFLFRNGMSSKKKN